MRINILIPAIKLIVMNFTKDYNLKAKIYFLILVIVPISSRRFNEHDRIAVVANTVGPYNNPTETYPVK